MCAGLWACGHSDTFRVQGSLEDGADINLRFVYYVDGAVRSGITASTKGTFVFEGALSGKAPSMVEIYDNDYRPLGRFVARNGEDIELTLNRSNPYKIKVSGNEESALWSAFLNEHADVLQGGSADARNEAVAAFVGSHASSPVSLYLLATEYDGSGARAAGADSLMALVDEDLRRYAPADGLMYQLSRGGRTAVSARVGRVPFRAPGNRFDTLDPAGRARTLIVMSDSRSPHDSIVDMLRRIHKRGRMTIYELGLDTDTLVWRRRIREDTVPWRRGWVAGGVTARTLDTLGVSSVPYFILVDSAGRQLVRAADIKEAERRLMSF